MAERSWKTQERTVARRLGGWRVSRLGARGHDIEGDGWIGEVKTREDLPHWLTMAMNKIVAQHKKGQVPLLVLHQNASQDSIVCIRLRDFAPLLQGYYDYKIGHLDPTGGPGGTITHGRG